MPTDPKTIASLLGASRFQQLSGKPHMPVDPNGIPGPTKNFVDAQELCTYLADWIEYGADLQEVPLPEEFKQHGDTEAELRVALGVVFRQWARGEPLPSHYGGIDLQEINQLLTGRKSISG